MQKYCIVHLIKPLPDGYEFVARGNWPLHITLASNFAVTLTDELEQKLTDLLSRSRPLSLTVGDEAYFGKDQSVHVSLIIMTPELRALHEDLIDLLESEGAVFDEPHYNRDGYRAHATIQKSTRLHTGDATTLDSASLIDMLPHSDISRRRVLRTTSFSQD